VTTILDGIFRKPKNQAVATAIELKTKSEKRKITLGDSLSNISK
jgi:hypothetical protein